MRGFSGSPERLTGVGSSLGRVRLTGLGCGKALWDSPGRDPGARGRRNFDNFRIQHGGPSRIHGGGWIHMVGARGVALGVTESSPCTPAVTWSQAVWGGDCSVWVGASDISLDRALERAPRANRQRAQRQRLRSVPRKRPRIMRRQQPRRQQRTLGAPPVLPSALSP